MDGVTHEMLKYHGIVSCHFIQETEFKPQLVIKLDKQAGTHYVNGDADIKSFVSNLKSKYLKNVNTTSN